VPRDFAIERQGGRGEGDRIVAGAAAGGRDVYVRLANSFQHSAFSVQLKAALLILAVVRTVQAQPVCATCHVEIAASYARTGMARTFGEVKADLPPIPGGVLRYSASGQVFSIDVRGGVPWLKRVSAGGANVMEKPIAYWIGSGNHARSFLARSGLGLVQLPLTEYKGSWGMSPGYDRADHAGFSKPIIYRCMFCHNAYPRMPAGSDLWDGGTEFPEKLPEGIDCQRCHGPGEAHVAAAQSGASADVVQRAIVNPARLSPERRVEVCLQCHLETTTLRLPAMVKRFERGVFSYRPGEPMSDYMLHFDTAQPGDRFEFNSSAYRLRQSACFRNSKGALTCTTCHNPHDIPRGTTATVSYAKACQSCHTSLPQRHPGGADCVGCHMIKRRPSDALKVMVTDHYIRRRPSSVAAGTVEHNDTNLPPYRGEVSLYYPATARDAELYTAVAQVRDQANLAAGIAALEAAIAREKPETGGFYLELAEALRHAGRPERAAEFYRKACKWSAGEWRGYYGLGLVLSAMGDLDGSASALRRAIELGPKETAAPLALSQLMTARNLPGDAIAVLQKAIDAAPDGWELYRQLERAERLRGNAAAADRAHREAVRLRPELMK
jgi:Flp pilus assembly protein TadD